MKHFIQIHIARTFMAGLMISVLALLTSCAPKQGCYFGMTPEPNHDRCIQDLSDDQVSMVEMSTKCL